MEECAYVDVDIILTSICSSSLIKLLKYWK